MPSPIGHALGGVVAGWIVGGPPRTPRDAPDGALRALVGSSALRRSALAFGLVALLPDLDLLVGTHSAYTHSIGAALVVSGVALVWLLRAHGDRGHAVRTSLAVGAAYASHILLDWLGTDGAPPIGVMALWPFSSDFYLAGVGLFAPVERRFSLPDFWPRTFRMLAIELGVLGSLLAVVVWTRRRRTCLRLRSGEQRSARENRGGMARRR